MSPPSDPTLLSLVSRHPYVDLEGDEPTPDLEFWRHQWRRYAYAGRAETQFYGLVELMDNNPLVCADAVSVPSPAATLALVAAGPALRAGMATDEAVFACSLDEPGDLGRAVGDYGCQSWIWTVVGESDGSVEMISAMIPVPASTTEDDIAALYEEAYSRSFYVRLGSPGDSWTPDDVRGRPFAKLQLRFTPGEDGALLNAVAMADRHGKLGAAQMVHAFNVMCGFEESSGIPEHLQP